MEGIWNRHAPPPTCYLKGSEPNTIEYNNLCSRSRTISVPHTTEVDLVVGNMEDISGHDAPPPSCYWNGDSSHRDRYNLFRRRSHNINDPVAPWRGQDESRLSPTMSPSSDWEFEEREYTVSERSYRSSIEAVSPKGGTKLVGSNLLRRHSTRRSDPGSWKEWQEDERKRKRSSIDPRTAFQACKGFLLSYKKRKDTVMSDGDVLPVEASHAEGVDVPGMKAIDLHDNGPAPASTLIPETDFGADSGSLCAEDLKNTVDDGQSPWQDVPFDAINPFINVQRTSHVRNRHPSLVAPHISAPPAEQHGYMNCFREPDLSGVMSVSTPPSLLPPGYSFSTPSSAKSEAREMLFHAPIEDDDLNLERHASELRAGLEQAMHDAPRPGQEDRSRGRRTLQSFKRRLSASQLPAGFRVGLGARRVSEAMRSSFGNSGDGQEGGRPSERAGAMVTGYA